MRNLRIRNSKKAQQQTACNQQYQSTAMGGCGRLAPEGHRIHFPNFNMPQRTAGFQPAREPDDKINMQC